MVTRALQTTNQSSSGLSTAVSVEDCFSSSWRSLKVQAFLSCSNWQGLPPVAAVLVPGSESRNSPADRLLHWQTLSVAAFLSEQNWQGGSVAIPVSFCEPEPSPVEVAVASRCPVMSVADFFTQVNWYGKPQAMTELSQPVWKCSLSMPVAEFMAAIAWEGQPAIAALPVSAPLPITPSREITLADLSELF